MARTHSFDVSSADRGAVLAGGTCYCAQGAHAAPLGDGGNAAELDMLGGPRTYADPYGTPANGKGGRRGPIRMHRRRRLPRRPTSCSPQQDGMGARRGGRVQLRPLARNRDAKADADAGWGSGGALSDAGGGEAGCGRNPSAARSIYKSPYVAQVRWRLERGHWKRPVERQRPHVSPSSPPDAGSPAARRLSETEHPAPRRRLPTATSHAAPRHRCSSGHAPVNDSASLQAAQTPPPATAAPARSAALPRRSARAIPGRRPASRSPRQALVDVLRRHDHAARRHRIDRAPCRGCAIAITARALANMPVSFDGITRSATSPRCGST